MLARMIDMTIWATVYVLALLLFSLTGFIVGGEVSQGFSLLLTFVMVWFYDPFFEASKASATPGNERSN